MRFTRGKKKKLLHCLSVWMRMTVASTIADFANRMGGQQQCREMPLKMCALLERMTQFREPLTRVMSPFLILFLLSSFPFSKRKWPLFFLFCCCSILGEREREKCANLDSHWESTGEREECASFVKWHFCVHYFFSLSFLLLLSRFYCWLLCLCLMCVCLVLSFYFFSFFFSLSQFVTNFLSIFSLWVLCLQQQL